MKRNYLLFKNQFGHSTKRMEQLKYFSVHHFDFHLKFNVNKQLKNRYMKRILHEKAIHIWIFIDNGN